MPIVVNLDVVLARRKMRSRELARRHSGIPLETNGGTEAIRPTATTAARRSLRAPAGTLSSCVELQSSSRGPVNLL